MSSDDENPKSRYGLSCPSGGTFYICQNSPTQFVGCCATDPCKNDGICPDDSLRTSSFSQGNYKDIDKEACVGGGAWYTCAGISPPFLGCCLNDPCNNNGCSRSNLTAAKLSSNPAEAAPFLTSSAPSPTSSTSTSTPSSAASSTSAPSSDSDSKGFPVGAIAGIVVGAVLAIAVIGFLLWRLRKSKKTFYHPPPVAQVPPSPQNEAHPHHPSGMYSPYKAHLDTFHNNGGTTPTTLVNSSATTTPRPPESFYDAQSVRTYSAPPLSPHGGSNQSHWSPPSVRHSRVVSSHSSLGSEYGSGGAAGAGGGGNDFLGAHHHHPGMPPKRYSGQAQHFQPMSEPISELAGSEVSGPQGTVSEIGWSDRDEERYSHQQPQRQQQQQAGLGIK
ncbi:hypothetical protein PG991_008343 [Apiospora marii]|uniref:Uncharacterized protein n=1 Tax=Apiospora marii TaxID=335849 RepID=A0ABR1RQV3_9PEZI